MRKPKPTQDSLKQGVNRKKTNHGAQALFAKGGSAMAKKSAGPLGLFKGTESYGEELAEAKAIKSGRLSPRQYAKGEKAEQAKKPAAKFAKKGAR